MRVAMLSTFHQRDGIAGYAENLVAELRAHGTEVHVLAPRLQSGDEPFGDQPPRVWNAHWAFGFAAFRVARLIEEAGCEVVHLQVNPSLFSSRFLLDLHLLLRRKRIPLVWTMHGRDGGSLGRRFKIWRIYRFLRGAHVLVHNRAHEAEMRSFGHTRVHVIPQGLPPVRRRPLAEAREALGLDPSRKVIAHFGFLVPDKGVLEMVRAVAQLRASRFPDLFYWISGALYRTEESRLHLQHLREEIARLGMTSHVHLTGEFVSYDDANSAMQAADWVVLNYLTGNAQGSSAAVTRALSSGRPVAVSDAPIFDDVRAAVHTLGSDLVTSLGDALSDPALSTRTMEAGAKYCDEASWSRVAERHIALYRAISGH